MQADEPVVAATLPVGQATHADMPVVAAILFAGHDVHAERPAVALMPNWPTAQEVQAEAAGSAYLPAAHVAQSVEETEPTIEEAVP